MTDRPRRQRTVYDRDLDDAMRAAADGGVPLGEIAAAAGLHRNVVGRRIGPRPRPSIDQRLVQQSLSTVAAAGGARRRRRAVDDLRLDNAMRAALDAGVVCAQVARAAGLDEGTLRRRFGRRRRPDTSPELRQALDAVAAAGETRRQRRTVYDRDLDDALHAAAAAGVPHTEIAEAAGMSQPGVSGRLAASRRLRHPQST